MLKRVLIILHLCLAFSVFLYLIVFPFLGAHFSLRSDLLVVESALGKSTLLQKIDPDRAALLDQSLSYKRDFLKEISPDERNAIYDAESLIHEQMGYSGWNRLSTLKTSISSVPLSLWAWIVLSVYFSVLLLKGRAVRPLTLLIIPALAFLYSIENYRNGALSPLERLIPLEQSLTIERKTDNESESWITREQSKIQNAWTHFLLSNYGNPQDEPIEKREALAEMRFQSEWIKGMSPDRFNPLKEKHALLTLFIFLFWNLYFTAKLSRSGQKIEKSSEDVPCKSA